MNHSKMRNTFSSMHSLYLSFLCNHDLLPVLKRSHRLFSSHITLLKGNFIHIYVFERRLYANDLIHLQICISNGLLAISLWMCPTTPQNKSDYLCFLPPSRGLPFKNKNKVYFTIFSILITVLAPWQPSDLLG